MKKLTIMTILSTAVLMSSCGLYKKYERPQMDIKGLVRDNVAANDTLVVTDESSFGDVAWQEVFTDPQLQALIEQGMKDNDDVLNAALSIKMAEAKLKAARLAYIPSFAFAPTGNFASVLTGDYAGSAPLGYALPISASWNVELFGNLVAENRSAKIQVTAAKDYEQAVRSRVICGIANCYYSLLMLDRQLELLYEMEKLTKDTWEMMKLQKELRGAKETAVVSAEAAYLGVQAKIVDMKRTIRETENTLCMIIGQTAQSISRGKLAEQSLPEKFSTGVAISVLSNRPDVHAAEMNLAQCYYGIQAARSRFYPALNISATGAFTNNLGGMVSNPGAMLVQVAATLAQPIFQNGKLIAGLRVAKAQYEQARNTWENTLIAAGGEVSDALVLYSSSKEKGELDRQQVVAQEKSVQYTKELFNMGRSSYLEVIQAQTGLLNAELSAVADDFNKMQAVVNLYSALGGGRK